MDVWLNGKFVQRDMAQVSVFDAAFQHGIGLFETLSARNGQGFRLDAHVARLVESARVLLLTDALRPDPLAEAVEQTLSHNDVEEARVRLTVTGGDLNRLAAPVSGRIDPTILIDLQPPTRYPESFFADGVMVTIADGRLNPAVPTAGHKTLDYWTRINALQQAMVAKAGESIWFTTSNHLASGSVSNVFLLHGERLCTPRARGEVDDEPSAVLPGITRGVVTQLAEGLGLQVEYPDLTIDDLLEADEVFLTNSSWGVLPVVAVERKQIGGGGVGSVTRQLLDAWGQVVEEETSESRNGRWRGG